MKYCLIGEKLSHSYSAEIHGDMGFNYTLNEIPSEKLPEFLRNCPFDGFNVTIPYKKAVMPYLSGISSEAEKIGAVNTVVNKNGKLFGYNTDAKGMEYALEKKGITLKNKNVMILGSGGAAAVARYVAQKQGAARIYTVSRKGAVNYDNCYDLENTEVIINATPVGMFPNTGFSPVIPERFKNLSAVFDLIYNPFSTELLLRAEKLKVKTANGLAMLVKQATTAEEIWSGKTISEETVRKEILKLYKAKSNLVFIGMPSSGKTTLGKTVAEILGKTFIDTDEEVLKISGRTPKDIIITDGEEEFRNIESAAVKAAATKTGAVISVGGGAVKREENVEMLKKNGIICYIERDLSLLSTENRPLSARSGIKELYEERKPLYERACDYKVENNGALKSAAERIIKGYENTCNKRA